METDVSVCQKCRRMRLECITYRSLQTLLEMNLSTYYPLSTAEPGTRATAGPDVAGGPCVYCRWKTMIEFVVTDILRKVQLPGLSYYQAGGRSSEIPLEQKGCKCSTVSLDDAAVPSYNDGQTDSSTLVSGGCATLLIEKMRELHPL